MKKKILALIICISLALVVSNALCCIFKLTIGAFPLTLIFSLAFASTYSFTDGIRSKGPKIIRRNLSYAGAAICMAIFVALFVVAKCSEVTVNIDTLTTLGILTVILFFILLATANLKIENK